MARPVTVLTSTRVTVYNWINDREGGEPMRTHRAALWRVIYIARSEQQAQQIGDLLSEAGFLVDWKRPDDAGGHREDIEIKALDSEAGEARQYLMEQGY